MRHTVQVLSKPKHLRKNRYLGTTGQHVSMQCMSTAFLLLNSTPFDMQIALGTIKPYVIYVLQCRPTSFSDWRHQTMKCCRNRSGRHRWPCAPPLASTLPTDNARQHPFVFDDTNRLTAVKVDPTYLAERHECTATTSWLAYRQCRLQTRLLLSFFFSEPQRQPTFVLQAHLLRPHQYGSICLQTHVQPRCLGKPHFQVGPPSWLSCPAESRSIECASDVWPWTAREHRNRYDERAPGLPTETVRFHASYTRLYYPKYDSHKTELLYIYNRINRKLC